MREVEMFGESFALNPREEYEWALAEFGHAAMGGADTNLLSGAAAIYDLLEASITAEDWPRFRALAKKRKAQQERDLMPIVVSIFTQAAERPTGLPSDSSDGQPATPERSEATSSSPVEREVIRLEKSGRPDRAVYLLEHLPA